MSQRQVGIDAADTGSGSGTYSHRLVILCFSAFLLLGVLIAHRQIFLSGFALAHGDDGDDVFLHYMLEHEYRFMLGDQAQVGLWNPPVFYPKKNTAAYSEIMFSTLPFYAVWRIFGSEATAFQLWQITVMMLNFTAFFFFIRYAFNFHPLACGGGAYLFTWAASRLNQTSHVQLWPQFYAVIALWGLLVFAQAVRDGNNRRAWIGLGLAVFGLAAQTYACFYYFWFLIVCILIGALWLIWRDRTTFTILKASLAQRIKIVASLIVLALLVTPALMHYWRAAQEVGLRPFAEVQSIMPRVASWFSHGPHSVLYGWTAQLAPFHETSFPMEKQLGLGFVTTVLIIAGFWLGRRNTLVQLAGVVTLVIVVITTFRAGHFQPYALFYEFIPGGPAVRAVARWGVFLTLAFGIALAFFLDRVQRTRGWIVSILLVLMIGAEQLVSQTTYPIHEVMERARRIAVDVRPECSVFAYGYIYRTPAYYAQQYAAMWAQLVSRKPSINGHSGNLPPRYGLMDASLVSRADVGRMYGSINQWLDQNRASSEKVCLVRKVSAPQLPSRRRLEGTVAWTYEPKGSARRACEQMYLDVLGRFPEGDEEAACLKQGAPSAEWRATSALALMDRPEFRDRDLYVAAVYLAMLDRDADYDGWLFATDELFEGNNSKVDTVANMMMSDERKSLVRRLGKPAPEQFAGTAFPVPGNPDPGKTAAWISSASFLNAHSDRLFVDLIYKVFLRRNADDPGRSFYLGELQRGIARSVLLRSILSSPEYCNRTGCDSKAN